MYARSTTIKGDPGALDAGITYVRDEVLPVVTTMDGCMGMSMVVDRESGRCIATTSWETKEAMDASLANITAYRSRAADILGGSPEIEEWEVALMHRDHRAGEGACCRITWGRPTDVDATVEMFKTTLLQQIEKFDGFTSASMFVDRGRGLTCGTVTFDSRAALEASRTPALELRERATQETGVQFLDVAEFELVLAHLRLPELV
jgi:quinol monooxygenase YgiN